MFGKKGKVPASPKSPVRIVTTERDPEMSDGRFCRGLVCARGPSERRALESLEDQARDLHSDLICGFRFTSFGLGGDNCHLFVAYGTTFGPTRPTDET